MKSSFEDSLTGREIIFEFRSAGAAAQVCAVDCASGVEVFITTPTAMLRSDQQTLVLRKLAKALIDQGVTQPIAGTTKTSEHPKKAPHPLKRGLVA